MHLFRFPNTKIMEKRREIIKVFYKKGLKGKVTRYLMDIMQRIFRTECENAGTHEQDTEGPEVAKAIRQQKQIRIHLMIYGYLAKG